MSATEETGLKLVRLELPTDVHKQFRIEAAREGMSMAALARKLVEEWTAGRSQAIQPTPKRKASRN